MRSQIFAAAKPDGKMRRLALILILVIMVQTGCDEDPIYSECPPYPLRIENAAGASECTPLRPLVRDSATLIQGISDAYLNQDYSRYEGLLAIDFHFVFAPSDPPKSQSLWNRETELLVHQRMFDPENIPPSDPPLDSMYWLQSVSINLTPEEAFAERQDLYTTSEPPGTLDPTRWKAEGAHYTTNVFFQLQGDVDYQISGRAYFVVLEDRTKLAGEPGKFVLYEWQDLVRPNESIAVEPRTWGAVKRLYL
jgi:hypothetical protein